MGCKSDLMCAELIECSAGPEDEKDDFEGGDDDAEDRGGLSRLETCRGFDLASV